MDTSIDGLDECIFGYESDASASFLVATGTGGASEYQCSMFNRNVIRRLIPPERMVKDGRTYFYYNITSKVSISTYLKRKKFSRPEFLKFIFDIASSVNDAYGYLLNSSNFIFRQDFIYICPDTLEPSLVYIPAARGGESCEALKSFVSELLLQHIQAEGFDSGNIVQRILCAVKSESFNLKDFVKLISELLYGGICESSIDTAVHDAADKQETAFYGEAAATVADKSSGRPDAGPETGPKAGAKAGSEAGVKAGPKAGNGEALQRRPVRLFAIFAVLLQFVMAFAIYLCRGVIDRAGANHTANYAAVLLIVAAIDVLISKKILTSGMTVLKSKYAEVGEGEQRPKGETKPESLKGVMPGSGASKPGISKPGISKPGISKPDIPKPGAFIQEAGSPEAVEPETGKPAIDGHAIDRPDVPKLSNKTELLGRHAKGARILKSTGKRAEEGDIVLDKDDFIIGRLEDHVDHVLYNNAVGKLHAELINRNGINYVKDLNSMNGTFINDSRIESNKEYELRVNDRLRLANSEYIFTYSV